MYTPIALPVGEESQVGEARRAAVKLAGDLDFDETERGKVALVVTEAARNLLQHAAGGELLLRPVERERLEGIEVLALDRGPGIADIDRCLQDGYSTAGTRGTGLGAIRRLSASWDIYSTPGTGTALLARLWARPASAPRREPAPADSISPMEVGAVCLPLPGEEACGDAWAEEHAPGRSFLLVVDGLGHGLLASEAAGVALRAFRERPGRGPREALDGLHAALRSTRGAAAAVAEIDREQRAVRFAGIGNIAGAILRPDGIDRTVSHSGTLGHQVRKIQEFSYPWPERAQLVMHSDGLGTQWSLDAYPGLAARDPGLIAGILYRDFKRGRDDLTVLVARDAAPGSGT